jgi:hypothetical protein
VNKRVKHQPAIGLPLLELWKLYSEANAAPMVRNFCIVYIEMAFERVHVKVCLSFSEEVFSRKLCILFGFPTTA